MFFSTNVAQDKMSPAKIDPIQPANDFNTEFKDRYIADIFFGTYVNDALLIPKVTPAVAIPKTMCPIVKNAFST